ncbi:unnamed protein product [Linum tenue]|uniref:Uncharacterized protein n=1 Tax=Linum tenue TaxID=586396 RepID=A0AAV0QK59_9ROSI|nr:unnamed protein product [Linum tenue]
MEATESSMGFHRDETLGSVLGGRAISFQSGAINSTSEMIPMGNYFGMSSCTTMGMVMPGNSTMANNNSNPGMVQVPSCNSPASSLLLDSVPSFKADTGLAVEWSAEEQYKLEEGLEKFSDEPSIMRYIKIAATIPEKTVRDVALRCRWMTRKRRKAEDYTTGKKFNNRREKLVESSSKMIVPSPLAQNLSVYPLMMQNMNQTASLPFEVSGISGTSRHLLEQNIQAFSQISANLSAFKVRWYLQKRPEIASEKGEILSLVMLSFQVKFNQDRPLVWFSLAFGTLTVRFAWLPTSMREMPGIMSQMPPLPVSINDDLANSLLPTTAQSMMFGLPGGMQLKQEPRC